LICGELEAEKTHLVMKLNNVDIIQRQGEKVKNRLSITYQKLAVAQDMNDPFRSAGKKNFNEPITEGIREDENEDEGYSLASQLGGDQHKGGLDGELNALAPSDDSGVGNTFESRDYFKKQSMRNIDTIMEDEKEKEIVMNEDAQANITKDEQPPIVDSNKTEQEPADKREEVSVKEEEEVKEKVPESKDEPNNETEKENKEEAAKEETLHNIETNQPTTQTGQTNLESTPNADKIMKEKFMNKIKEENKKMVAALGSSGLDIRPSKIVTFDFLTLKKNPKVLKMLNGRKETMSNVIFSDYMYLIKRNDLSQKVKHILYVSENGIYVLLKQSCKVKRVTPLYELESVIVVKTSGILVALHFEKA